MKLSLVLVLLVIGLVSVYGKRAAKAHKRYGETVYPKMFDRIRYLGTWKDCEYRHTIDQAGNGCTCVFVGCTGSQECISPSMLCALTHDNVNSADMREGDCRCQWLDQENGLPHVVKEKKSKD